MEILELLKNNLQSPIIEAFLRKTPLLQNKKIKYKVSTLLFIILSIRREKNTRPLLRSLEKRRNTLACGIFFKKEWTTVVFI